MMEGKRYEKYRFLYPEKKLPEKTDREFFYHIYHSGRKGTAPPERTPESP